MSLTLAHSPLQLQLYITGVGPVRLDMWASFETHLVCALQGRRNLFGCLAVWNVGTPADARLFRSSSGNRVLFLRRLGVNRPASSSRPCGLFALLRRRKCACGLAARHGTRCKTRDHHTQML